MSNYTKSTNFATKDNLTPGDPLKIVRGTEIDTEFNNIATAIATKTDNASAALTGGTINDTTIGATTASTGAFTTLAASGNVTLSGGTANGVAYLNGSKVVTSGSALQFDGSNLGLGVTPSAWNSAYKAVQVGVSGGASFFGGSGFAGMAYNYSVNTSGQEIYTTTNASLQYVQVVGQHRWYNAPSGTAGNAITFTQAMTLDASGNLGVGVTAPGGFRFATAGGRVNINSSDQYAIRIGNNGTYGAYLGSTAVDVLNFYNSVGNERARIDSSGDLLVGTTTSAGSKITVNNVGNGGVYVIQNSAGGYSFASNAIVLSGVYYHMQMLQSGTPVGSITSSGSTTQYNTSSDYRLKNITGALTGYKERLMSLQPKQGTWIVDGSEFRGFLAHDFANPYRASVVGEKDAVDTEGNPVMQAMQASSSEVMADLVALVQEQQAIIESLKARLDAANL